MHLGLLGAEFDLMEGLLKQVGINAVGSDLFECGEEHVLDFLEVIDFDALDTESERSLSGAVVETGSWAQLRSDLGFDYRLEERRVRSVQENIA